MTTETHTEHTPLYNPAYEHDACGVGFVADTTGATGRRVLAGALRALDNLAHRGAVGADARTSDGAGVLTQVPVEFFHAVVPELAAQPALTTGELAVGVCFLPRDDDHALARCQAIVEDVLAQQALPLLAWRAVPTAPEVLGDQARAALPTIVQVLVGLPEDLTSSGPDVDEFERRLLLARRLVEQQTLAEGLPLYMVSFSARTIVYKGLLAGGDLAAFYPDLADPRYKTALAVFHQRYSTNTAPTWQLAQPFRLLAHNGEINTVQGNKHWMAARELGLRSPVWGARLSALWPIVQPGGSDSAALDNVLELLVHSERNPLEALALLVAEAWEGRELGDLDPARHAFYAYHAPLMEPWDGPAALAFSDGRIVGAALDRNGLRPARFRLTDDNLLIVASEAGVLEPAGEETATVLESGRLGPGQILAVDLERGLVLHHDAILGDLAAHHPYQEWFKARTATLPSTAESGPAPEDAVFGELAREQRRFGYTAEDLRLVLTPMGAEGHEAVWSMGDDTPPAVLSAKPQHLANYFRQRFAQVTNPPIDPLRERLVMALDTDLGPRSGLLAGGPAPGRLIHLPSPIMTPGLLHRVRYANSASDDVTVVTLRALGDPHGGAAALATALNRLQDEAVAAVKSGATIVIVSNQVADASAAPMPMLLAVGAVHQALVAAGHRFDAEIVAEAGDAWSVHHLACLLAYGAAAVCPYLACASVRALATVPPDATDSGDAARDAAVTRYVAALEEGLLKVMSKMGISTVRSYRGSGLFEALGLGKELVNAYFPGTPSPLGGIGLAEIAAEIAARHAAAEALPTPAGKGALPDLGFVRFRRDGERHAYAPLIVKALQNMVDAADDDRAEAAARYQTVATNDGTPMALRDLLALEPAGPPLPLDAVEPAATIRRRFVATAMSLGALSPEAYSTLASGMNRMGARSNSGEGGEDPAWYAPQADGEVRHSKIKQVASARFGVTAQYLIHAEELEIKMAQGSKPGEGGQLPAHKVTNLIGRLRHAVPGTSLISPPPHHDIYSIEDLAQLIFDLRAISPAAKVGVKLVATSGVGTIAAGVAKAGADYVLVSGHSGGTGASPLGSIKHAGLPWELGLAEAQQTLIRSGLRDRVRLRTDGGLRSARDVVIAAALGAEEFGFGTAALVAMGCDMARQCHLNTCPTGIATQRDELRAKFRGRPEQVVAYFTWLAEEVRALLASLGLSSLDDAVGRVALLTLAPAPDSAAATLDLTPLLAAPAPGAAVRQVADARPANSRAPLTAQLVAAATPALTGAAPVTLRYTIHNQDRTTGAELAGELARQRAAGQVTPRPIDVSFAGSAGQSFGAFCVPGLTLRLTGEANDYVGKSMSGGTIAIRPAGHNAAGTTPVLVGNTVLYGATGGDLFVAGAAGERFAVRNSGAVAVVEGVGDHGCEYMTGGAVLVLGPTGRNFAAGMSAGRAYVLDPSGDFPAHCNTELVTLERIAADSEDAAQVHELLERHLAHTGSQRAASLLAAWGERDLPFWVVRALPPVVVTEPAPRPVRTPRREPGARPKIAVTNRWQAPDEAEPVSASAATLHDD